MERLVGMWVGLALMGVLAGAAWRLIRNRFVRALLFSGVLLVMLGSLGNMLVMTLNGGVMPVESRQEWERAPEVFSGPLLRGSFVCRIVGPEAPSDQPSEPAVFDGVHREVGEGERPRLAWLDDRHPIVICGTPGLYSRGDSVIAIGLTAGIVGALSAFFIWIASAVRRRKAAKKS